MMVCSLDVRKLAALGDRVGFANDVGRANKVINANRITHIALLGDIRGNTSSNGMSQKVLKRIKNREIYII